jgi:putative ABC transport system permease protein
MLTDLIHRLRSLARRKQVESELDDELRFHVDHQAEKHQAAGATNNEALRRARLELGGMDRAKEESRDARGTRPLEDLVLDIRYGLRMLRKSPGFTAVAVLTLALGIGANTAIFSVVDAVMLRVVPYPQPDRIAAVIEYAKQFGTISLDWPDFTDWQSQNQVFDAMAAYQFDGTNLTGSGEPLRLSVMRVSASFFTITGYQPPIGRDIADSDDRVGAVPTVMLTNAFWRTHFGSDPSIVGKSLTLGGQSYAVIGVLPADFWVREPADIVVPIALSASDPDWQDRGEHPGIRVMARLKPDVTLAQAAANMMAVAWHLESQYRKTNSGETAIVRRFRDVVVGDNLHSTLFVLLAAVGFVLLIACANVGNLLLARSSFRQREMAVRAALGASRKRLIAQAITESMLLSFAGGIVGLLFGMAGIQPVLRLAPQDINGIQNIHLSLTVFALVAAISILAGVLFGVIPAWQISRPDVLEVVRQSSRTASASRSSARVRSSVLIAEVAVALVLSAGAGLMVRSIIRVESAPVGFQPENLLTLNVSLPLPRYAKSETEFRYFTDALARINAVPSVLTSSIVRCLPMAGDCWDSTYVLSDRPIPDQADLLQFDTNVVTPDYFRTLGIPLVRGRTFSDRDDAQSPPVVVVNETLARRMWPHGVPQGVRIKQGRPQDPYPYREIVGVVGDVKRGGLDADQGAEVFMPFAQKPGPNYAFTVRTAVPPMSIAQSVEAAIHSVDSDQPITDVQPIEQYMTDSVARRKFSTLLLTIFGGLALVLSAIGIYGVMAYTLSLRTRELGIRTALGAQRADLLRLVIGEGLRLALAGVVIGLAAALALTHLLGKFSLLFNVSATDPLTFAVAVVVLLLVALAACYLPAYRASRTDPLVALRIE